MRVIFYCLVAAVLIASVFVKARINKARAGKTVVSTTLEWERHGKPVDAAMIKRGNMDFYKRVSGIYDGDRTIDVLVSPDTAAVIAPGQIFFSEMKKARFTGTVKTVNKYADTTTGLHSITLLTSKRIPFKQESLIKVRIQAENYRNLLRIPLTAVMKENNGTCAWLIRDKKVTKIKIRLGRSNATHRTVFAGLKEGDRVVTFGKKILKENDVVRIHTMEDGQ